MKLSCRRAIVFILFLLIQDLFFLSTPGAGSPPPFEIGVRSAVLLDALSGQVIFEQNSREKIAPASLVKILTLYLAYDALEMGMVKPNDKVLISEKAWATKGSKMFIEVNKRVELQTLLEGIAAISGNDACVAVAEYLAGLEEAFVSRMNEKVKSLGMTNSSFVNVNGLPAEDQYTTAADIGILSYHYLKEHPEALKIHGIKEFTFSGITQYNRNGLLWLDEGVDGLKTGWINDNAGFHLVATAKRGDQRFIAVVMGAKNQRARENEALKLLNYGFRNYSTLTILNGHESVETVDVWKGRKGKVSLVSAEPVIVTVPVGEEENLTLNRKIPMRVFAPLHKGEKVGTVEVTTKGKLLKKVDLIAKNEVPSGGLLTRATHMVMLSFILPPYWGCLILLLVLLLIFITRMIKKKAR